MTVRPQALDFFSALATGKTWQTAVISLLQQMPELTSQHRLGVVYVTTAWEKDYNEIIYFLKQTSGIPQWSGMLSAAIFTQDLAYLDQAAIGILLLPCREKFYQISSVDTIIASPGETILMHVLAQDIHTLALLDTLSDNYVFPFGMISHPVQQHKNSFLNLTRSSKTIHSSAIRFHNEVSLATIENSSCRSTQKLYQITSRDPFNNILMLDDRPALNIMKEAILEDYQLNPKKHQDNTQIFLTMPIAQSDSSKRLIRNITNIDNTTGGISTGALPENGDYIGFAVRDLDYALTNIKENLQDLKNRIRDKKILAGIYISCSIRGRWLLENDISEINLIRDYLGAFPMLGCFAAATIYHQYWNLQNSILLVIIEQTH